MGFDVKYDTAVIGGGLAGLTLAINLGKKGFKVILIEKETYPFHKVCGEYISLESWQYLQSLGLPLDQMNLPIIKRLQVTAVNGKELQQDLPLGGFGISRYKIDNSLKDIAIQSGVTVIENCKATDVSFKDDQFFITTSAGIINCRVCCGSFGKRSNLDIKWKRKFTQQPPNKLNNFIAVKYHISSNHPNDLISLHNFENGYCGISKIEDGKYCLCYLTNAANLSLCNNSIEEMELKILGRNPHLKKIFSNSTKLYDSAMSISQISFERKSSVQNHVLMVGDAAGLITPLCGNGMSMAMHAGKIAAENIKEFLENNISRNLLEKKYTAEWEKNFKDRLRTGRIVQRFFGKSWITNIFISIMKLLPSITKMIIRKTHGDVF